MKYLIAILAIVLTSSCEDDNTNVCDPTPQFDIDLFIEGVQDDLNNPANPVSGYQFAVTQNGNLYHSEADGFGRHEDDTNGPIAMVEDTQLNIASVSKFIGAIAMMKVMEEHNIQINDNVIERLPPTWQIIAHPDFSDSNNPAYLTFDKLLRHETAIRFVGPAPPSSGSMLSESDMLISLASEPDLSRDDDYQNANFTLIRVLIGEIVYDISELDPITYSIECTEKYFEYLRDNIFDPLQINTRDTPALVNSYYNSTTYPYAYQYPFNPNFSDATGAIGWAHTSDPYLNGGSGGLILSALDVAKITAFLKYDNTNTLMTSIQRNDMLAREYGLSETITNGAYGTYLGKRGTRGPQNVTNRAVRSMIFLFPNNVEAVLISNSLLPVDTILRSNYDAAWVNPCQ